MRARVVVAAVALVAALAAGATLALRGRDRDVGDAARERDEVPAASPGTLAVAPRAATTKKATVRGTCSVVGVVRDGRAGGRPIAARITAWLRTPYVNGQAVAGTQETWASLPRDETAAPPDVTTEADGEGRFTLAGLAPGEYIVRAEASASPPVHGLAGADLLFDGAREQVTVTVVSASLSLVVKAQRADGSPWRVRVSASGSTASPVADTDETGTAVLSGFGAGDVELDAHSEADGISIHATVTVPRTDPFVITEPAGLVELSGRVIDAADGKPIAAAHVASSASIGDTWIAGFGVTGSDGAFRVRLAPTAHDVTAVAAGYSDTRLELHGKATGLVIAMRRRARLSGTVVEAATKSPVAGARVLVNGVDSANQFPFMFHLSEDLLAASLGTAETDAGGHFSIEVDVPDGSTGAELSAIGSGFCSKGIGSPGSEKTVIELAAGGETTVTLEVERAARVTGRVVDVGGKPAPGALVRVVAGGTRQPSRWQSMSLPELGPSAVTAADGHFVLDTVLPGVEASVSARAGRVWGPSVAIGALEAGAVRDVEVQIARTRRVVVTVLSAANGEPVKRADVGLHGDDDEWQSATADDSGVATFAEVSAAAVTVRATAPDDVGMAGLNFARHDDAEVAIAAVELSALADVAVTARIAVPGADAAARGGVVAGTVRYEDGTPAVGALVSVAGASDRTMRFSGRSAWFGASAQVQVGADGQFRLDLGDAPTAKVLASVSRLGVEWSAEVDAAAGTNDLSITLKLAGAEGGDRVRVRVLDADGRPVPSGKVDVAREPRAPRGSSDVVIVDGEFEFVAEAEDRVTLTIVEARGIDGTRLPVAKTTVGPVPKSELPAEIRLRAEKTIEGFVRTPDGQPVSGVTVSAAPADEERPPDGMPSVLARFRFATPDAASARSGVDGAFRVRWLDDGEYQIDLSTPNGYVEEDRDVRATAGATGLVLTLRPGVEVVLRVLDADGKPIVGATADAGLPTVGDGAQDETWVMIRRTMSRSGFAGGGASDATGALRLGKLDPAATYTLHVDPPESRKDARSKDIEGWKPAATTIRLDRAFVTRGVVRSPSGEALAGVGVTWKIAERMGSVETNERGEFDTGPTAAGELELDARYGASSFVQATARAVAGAQDVVLVLDPGAELSVRFESATSSPEGVHIAPDNAQPSHWASQVRARDGVFRFRGLEAGRTYTVWAIPNRDSLTYLSSGLRASASESRAPVIIRRVDGRGIRVRVAGPAGLEEVSARAERGPVRVEVNVALDPSKATTIGGLVDGRWHVVVEGTVGDVSYEGSADADAGGEVEVRLEPSK